MATLPEQYQWTSYRCYIGQNASPDWLKTDLILGYFGERTTEAESGYRRFVEEPFGIGEDSPLKAAVAGTILGSSEFVQDVVKRELAAKRDERNVPAVNKLMSRLSLDEIVAKLEADFGDEKRLRAISIYCCQKYSGAKLKEIGERFGVSDAAVSQTSRRLVLKCEEDRQLRETLMRAGNLLTCVRS